MLSEFKFKDEWKRPITLGVMAIVGAVLLVWLLQDDPIAVDLHTVATGPMTVTIDEEGVTQIRDVFKVSAPIAGRVKRSPLKVGDPVRQGKTIVAELEPVIPSFLDQRTRQILDARAAAAQSAVALAKAAVERAQADLEFSDKELVRKRSLIKRNTISQRQLDEAILAQKTSAAARNTALAELSVRERELESARAQLIAPTTDFASGEADCCIRVLAPISGRVIRIVTESETVVQSGTPLLELGDPANLEVVVDLLSVDAVRVRESARAEILAWGGEVKLNAVVSRVEPTGFKKVSALGIEEQRVNVRLSINEPFTQRLRLGHDYRVFVRIVEWHNDNVLNVPLSALFRQGASWALFTVSDDIAVLKTVEIGRRNGRDAQITNGLSESEMVILHPNDRITDGTRVVRRADNQ
ncbi:MAG: efflux RND transporter periplasmic adaptor subunit [Hyphomicrobiaceae bacterium]